MTLTGATKLLQRLQAIPLVLIAIAAIPASIWALDRSPPLRMTSSEPVTVQPGKWLRVVAHVERDYRRKCSANVTAVLFDSAGTRYLLGGTSEYNVQSLDYIDNLTPGVMIAAAPLSPIAAPGQGHAIISMVYRCNPLHILWPIQVLWDIPFTVVP